MVGGRQRNPLRHMKDGDAMARGRNAQSEHAHRVYDLYVKPVEQTHQGQYVLVTPDGQTIFAPTLVEVMQRAHQRPSPDNYIFKVGEIALGTLR